MDMDPNKYSINTARLFQKVKFYKCILDIKDGIVSKASFLMHIK